LFDIEAAAQIAFSYVGKAQDPEERNTLLTVDHIEIYKTTV